MLMRFLGLASVVGIIAIAGAAGAISLRGGDSASASETAGGATAPRQDAKPTKSGPARQVRAPRPLTPTPARAEPAAEPVRVEAPSVPPANPSNRSRAGGSVLGEGRTALTDSIFAIRSGDSVTVNFDTKGNRTRRADKFEQMVRTTLPMVYGKGATSALDSVPQGSLLPSRDVIGELTSEGVHLRLDNGLRISLWPQTRPTNDGPLVVAYRVVVSR
jgi:hypothetical protein